MAFTHINTRLHTITHALKHTTHGLKHTCGIVLSASLLQFSRASTLVQNTHLSVVQQTEIIIIIGFRLVAPFLFTILPNRHCRLTTMLRFNYQSGIHAWINRNDKDEFWQFFWEDYECITSPLWGLMSLNREMLIDSWYRIPFIRHTEHAQIYSLFSLLS